MKFYVCMRVDVSREMCREFQTFLAADNEYTAIVNNINTDQYKNVLEVTKGRIDPAYGRIRHANFIPQRGG